MSKAKQNQPNYVKYLTFNDMDQDLELFDEIPFKFVRKYHEEEDIEVEILDLEYDRVGWSKTLFKFELECYKGKDRIKEFEVVLEYSNSSWIAPYLTSFQLCACCNKSLQEHDYGSKLCIYCDDK